MRPDDRSIRAFTPNAFRFRFAEAYRTALFSPIESSSAKERQIANDFSRFLMNDPPLPFLFLFFFSNNFFFVKYTEAAVCRK